jgi:hypothetical protein
MFDHKTSLTGRLTDAVDLIIEFATLGEYGLEPTDHPAARPCETRRRPLSGQSRQAPRRVLAK